ncbi:hypothetical protein F511_35556 [Dorcoceras hygrometricum]|uniref:Uncharacterized protein n=1 Tax=Dorcoceras hygrometricum TaxID=472368 RepID=A0A2Z7DAP0_9LAMI|nr:hypothetical protein F511_35556 [Dorcoceras hygrometricum]
MCRPVAHPVGEINSHRAPTSKQRPAADHATIERSGAQLSAAMRGQRATKCARLLATAGHHAQPVHMLSRIQLAVGPQPLWLRNHNSGLAHRIMNITMFPTNETRYISINDKISIEEVEDVGDVSRVKKTPVKRVVSKKRHVTAVDEPTVKKKKTRVGKAAVTLQVIKPITAAPPKPKRKASKRRLKLPAGYDDEIADKDATVEDVAEKLSEKQTADVVMNEPVVETFVEKEKETSGDDVDSIIQKILEDTAQFKIVIGEPEVTGFEELVSSNADGITVGDTEKLVAAKGQQLPGTETEEDAVTTADELLSIEEHLAQIPDNAFLPSVMAVDITQTRFYQGIAIREDEISKVSLPQIAETDKGKVPLVEEFVQGDPAREIFSLICADIDFLVQLPLLFPLYSIFFDPVTPMGLGVTIKARQQNFVSGKYESRNWSGRGHPAHSILRTNVDCGFFVPRDHRSIFSKCWIRAKLMEDGTWLILEGVDFWRPISQPVDSRRWETVPIRPYVDDFAPMCAFIDPVPDIDSRSPFSKIVWDVRPRALIIQTHAEAMKKWNVVLPDRRNTRTAATLRSSTSQLQLLKLVYNDRASREESKTTSHEQNNHRKRQESAGMAHDSGLTVWAQWADVCVDAVQFSLLGSMRPVGSVNFCRDTVIHSSAIDILERLPNSPNSFCGIFQQGQDTNSFVGYFSDSVVRPVLQSLPDVDLVSSDGSTVYHSPYPQSESSKSFHDTESTEPNVQDTGFDQDQQSDSSSSSEQLDFHEKTSTYQFVFVADTPAVGTAPAPTQTSLPPPIAQMSKPVTTDVSASFAELRASISRLIANQTRDYRRLDQAFRGMIKNIRQEAHNDADVFSMKLEASRTQNVILRTELADVRQEVKAQKSELFKEIDDRLATIRSEQLDLRAQAQENYHTLSTQLGFLVDYINRGGDAKKEEGGRSRPQPPPDDQNRPSGGSASRGNGSGGSSRRDDRRDSSKKRRSSSGGGGSSTGDESYGPYGPYKKDAEYWLPRAENSKTQFRRPKRRNLAEKQLRSQPKHVSLARWTVSEGIALVSCENVKSDLMLKTRAVESDVEDKRSGSSYEQKNDSDVRRSLDQLEHCDVLSMQMDSDLVIYRTTLIRTFQVVTICRVDKSKVYLVTHAMSLFDLQGVCIAIGSLATLDLPMVVDLIGIYVLKGPYCTLTMTNWFLQALSVIPRGSWGDVARRFTMIRWGPPRAPPCAPLPRRSEPARTTCGVARTVAARGVRYCAHCSCAATVRWPATVRTTVRTGGRHRACGGVQLAALCRTLSRQRCAAVR